MGHDEPRHDVRAQGESERYIMVDIKVSITVNGTQQVKDVEPRTLLVHFLRDQLQLTGTNIGCDLSLIHI